MSPGPSSKGRTPGLIPKDTRIRVPLAPRCIHERKGYLEAWRKALALNTAVLGILGFIFTITSGPRWLIPALVYGLMTACSAGQWWVWRLRGRDIEAEIEAMKALSKAASSQYEQSKTEAPTVVLEAVLEHPLSPPDLRADVRAELARRKGWFN